MNVEAAGARPRLGAGAKRPAARRRPGLSARARKRLGLALEITVPIAILAGWWLWSADSGSIYWPPLSDILDSFRDTWLFERASSDVLPSLRRMGIGYGVGVVAGVGVGILLGLSGTARRAASPIVEFLRAIPPPALIPFAIVVIGVDDTMKIFIIAFVCVWPVLMNTIDGIAGIDPTLTDTSRVYGIRGRERLLKVVLPAASPQIIAGMRTSLSLALILMVISEMVASTNGLGFYVVQAQRSFAIAEMWSGILLLGLLGYILNVIFLLIERRAMAWHRGARASALN